MKDYKIDYDVYDDSDEDRRPWPGGRFCQRRVLDERERKSFLVNNNPQFAFCTRYNAKRLIPFILLQRPNCNPVREYSTRLSVFVIVCLFVFAINGKWNNSDLPHPSPSYYIRGCHWHCKHIFSCSCVCHCIGFFFVKMRTSSLLRKHSKGVLVVIWFALIVFIQYRPSGFPLLMNICMSLFHFFYVSVFFLQMMTLSLPSKACLSLGQRIAPFLSRCRPIMLVCVNILTW